jgi:hypothetical protein
MASYVKYETTVENLANKLIDAFGTTDTWRVLIHTDAPTVATDNNAKSDLTQISNANGYTTDGENATFNSTRSGGTVTATAADIVWTASGGNLGNSTTGRYFTLYDDTSAADNVWASWDYGATFTVATGETMTWDVGASIWTLA